MAGPGEVGDSVQDKDSHLSRAMFLLSQIEKSAKDTVMDWDGVKGTPGLIYRIEEIRQSAATALDLLRVSSFRNTYDSVHGTAVGDDSPTTVESAEELMTPESIRKAMDEDEDGDSAQDQIAETKIQILEFMMENSIMVTFRGDRIVTSIGAKFLDILPKEAEVSIKPHQVTIYAEPSREL